MANDKILDGTNENEVENKNISKKISGFNFIHLFTLKSVYIYNKGKDNLENQNEIDDTEKDEERDVEKDEKEAEDIDDDDDNEDDDDDDDDDDGHRVIYSTT